MELQLATCANGISQTANSTPQLRGQSVFTQIEADLEQSEIYQRVMAGLEHLAEDTLEATQALLQAFGREAIRFTFQQIAQHYHVVPDTLKKKVVSVKTKNQPETDTVQTSVEEYSTELQDDEMPPSPNMPSQSVQTPTTATIKPIAPPAQTAKKSKKSSKFVQTTNQVQRDRLLAEERLAIFRQIGQTIKEARLAQGISFGALYSKTLVQVAYIKAIEEGNIERLPEDVYLRGFIRRLGNGIGLDGMALANSLPKPAQETVVPSWYSPNINVSGPALNPPTTLEMYLGYTALVAGAVGGLAWMTADRPNAEATIEPEAPQLESVSQFSRHGSDRVTTSEQLSAEIAPPEAVN